MTRLQQRRFEDLFAAEMTLRRAFLHLAQCERPEPDALAILANLYWAAIQERDQLKAQVAA